MKSLNDYTLEDFTLDESFQRYARDGSETDRVIWEEYLRLHPEKAKLINEAKSVINKVYVNISPKEFNYELDKFKSIVEANKVNRDFVVYKKSNWKYAVAASVTAVLFISVFALLYRINKKVDRIEIVEHHTEERQQKNIVLADQSKVRINAATTISYPKEFARNKREVYLDGEAFFEVEKDVNRPFIVHLGELDVRVLGTSFNVRHYQDEEQLEVALLTGKVEIIRDNQVLLSLTPKDEAIYDKASGNITKNSFDPNIKLAWTSNTIKFDKASFDEIVQVLERYYRVEIIYDQSIDSDGFTGEFDAASMSLEHILEGLGHSLGFNFTIDNQQIKISTN